MTESAYQRTGGVVTSFIDYRSRRRPCFDTIPFLQMSVLMLELISWGSGGSGRWTHCIIQIRESLCTLSATKEPCFCQYRAAWVKPTKRVCIKVWYILVTRQPQERRRQSRSFTFSQVLLPKLFIILVKKTVDRLQPFPVINEWMSVGVLKVAICTILLVLPLKCTKKWTILIYKLVKKNLI